MSATLVRPAAGAAGVRDRTARLAQLEAELARRVLVLDGAMGTMIQRHRLGEDDYRGLGGPAGDRFAHWPSDLKGNNDLLSITRPDVIAGIHRAYLDAGADILETNTFNSTSVSMADYGMSTLAYELNVAGARLARAAADDAEAEDPERPRWVAGVLGPTSRTASISPDVNDPGFRNVTFEELAAAYTEAAEAAVVVLAQPVALDHRPHGPVEDEDAAGQLGLEPGEPGGAGLHGRVTGAGVAVGEEGSSSSRRSTHDGSGWRTYPLIRMKRYIDRAGCV